MSLSTLFTYEYSESQGQRAFECAHFPVAYPAHPQFAAADRTARFVVPYNIPDAVPTDDGIIFLCQMNHIITSPHSAH